jgi:hypothetical protein
MPRVGGYALVLDPIVFSETHTCRFSRVLIDGGSSINLLYRTSMEKLGIPAIQLKPTKLTFHGIVPGYSCMPMGRIELEVLFGGKDNHRREPIWFEVVDLNSPYHALLGRPTYPGQVHGSPALCLLEDEASWPLWGDYCCRVLQEVNRVRKGQL